MTRTVALLLFDGVEVLDFAGPFEVLAAVRAGGEMPFRMITVAPRGGPVHAVGGLVVEAGYDLRSAPAPDILVVPGGPGARERELWNRRLLTWIRAVAGGAERVCSVCTGAFLLAEAGLLDGRAATTHAAFQRRLAAAYPAVRVVSGVPFTEDGMVLTSAGVATGIPLALHLVDRLVGTDAAAATARYLGVAPGHAEMGSGQGGITRQAGRRV